MAGVLTAFGTTPVWCANTPASSPALGKWGGPPADKVVTIVPPIRAESPKDGVSPRIEFAADATEGRLSVKVDGAEAFVYRYGTANELPFPCLYPVWSPSGKALTEQGNVFPWPHHESFWFVNDVKLDGQEPSAMYYSLYHRTDPNDWNSPFTNQIVQVEFLPQKQQVPDQAEIGMKLLWQKSPKIPLADQEQHIRVVALGGGEYFLDMHYRLTASYGKLTFVGDNIHYAWPMARMQEAFSPEKGAQVTNSEGSSTVFFPEFQVAHWVDMSNTVSGVPEGLALFSHSENPYPHKWFVHKHGMFGPRRIDAQDGKPFALEKGESIGTRVGVLIHKGDATAGKVAQRYADYIAGKL